VVAVPFSVQPFVAVVLRASVPPAAAVPSSVRLAAAALQAWGSLPAHKSAPA
jgi:hypothetical protein